MDMKTLVSPRQQLIAKFDRLFALENGWYEGRGVAFDKAQLTFVAVKLSAGYPDLTPPLITPTPEGNLLFEWDVPGSPSVDLELASLRAEFHALTPDGSDIERDFTLKTDDDWREFFGFLVEHVSAQ